MRVRALGAAMVLFGLVGALVSFGAWWMLYRYSRGPADVAGIETACVTHCGGVDGVFLVGVVASIGLGLVGIMCVVVSLRPRPAPSV